MNRVVFSPNGRYALTGGYGLKLWDLRTGKLVRVLAKARRKEYWYPQMVFSPNGKLILTGGKGPVGLWETATGKRVRWLIGKGVRYPTMSVAFGPGARLAATAGDGGIIKIWDVAKGKELKTLSPHNED
jgi:WD40 repeat protein